MKASRSIGSCILMVLCFAAPAHAGFPGGPQEGYVPPPPQVPQNTFVSPFSGPSWNVGGFLEWLTPDADQADTVFGGGIMAEHFFTDFFGLSGSAAWARPNDDLLHSYTMDLVLRYPLASISLAPYVLGGGGALVTDGTDLVGRAGVGLEWRPTTAIGVFTDWLYHFPGGGGGADDLEDFQTIRAGMKFRF